MTDPRQSQSRHHRVDTGGLFRCCIATVTEQAPTDPSEGEILPCKWCSESVTWRNGSWVATWKGDNG